MDDVFLEIICYTNEFIMLIWFDHCIFIDRECVYIIHIIHWIINSSMVDMRIWMYCISSSIGVQKKLKVMILLVTRKLIDNELTS